MKGRPGLPREACLVEATSQLEVILWRHLAALQQHSLSCDIPLRLPNNDLHCPAA